MYLRHEESAMTSTCCCSYGCDLGGGCNDSQVVVSGGAEAHMLSLQVIKKTLIARKRSYNRSAKGETACLQLLARLARTKTLQNNVDDDARPAGCLTFACRCACICVCVVRRQGRTAGGQGVHAGGAGGALHRANGRRHHE